MSDDLLERATAALRETTSAPLDGAARERARLLAAAAVHQRSAARPANLWQWAAVIVAGFMVSTAMAHYTGVMPALIEAVSRTLAATAKEPAKPPPKAPKSPRPPQRPADPQPSAAGAAAPAAPAPALDPAPLAPEVPAPALRRPARKPAPPPAASSGAARGESPELLLFRRAQALQSAHDERTLAAWDAYLRVASSGALTPEARYNRALCLLYLKRYHEARTALEPFASGSLQGYRQREAQALLERLPAR